MASLEEEQKGHTDSLCVKVNKTRHTIIKAWQSPKCDDHKEVILHKEIEMSNTYRVIGTDQDQNVKHIADDNDSFYGSDKETDDIVMFSEDEGQNDKYEDSSSSDEEQINKVIKLNNLFYNYVCSYTSYIIIIYNILFWELGILSII